MPDYQIDVGVMPQAARFPAELEAIVGRAEAAQPPAEIRLSPKLTPGFESEAKAKVKESLARLDAQVLITPKLAKSFRTDVERMVKEMTKGTGVEVPVQAKLGPGFRAKLQRLIVEESKLKALEVPISPTLDRRGYARFTTDLRARMDQASADGVTAVHVRPELAPGFTEDLDTKVRAAVDTASASAVVHVRAETTGVAGKSLLGVADGGMLASGKAMSKSLTVPILAVGAAMLFSAAQVDKGYEIVKRRTGETGATLRGLDSVYDSVNKKSVQSMTDVAETVAQFHQRLGIGGPALEGLTSEFLTLERIAGTGAPTVDAVAKAMVSWHVATADQATEMDHLFVASQKTGVPMSVLVDDVTRFGPQLRAANLSLDHSTTLMGMLEKAGVPVGRVMLGVTSYLAKVSKAGGDAAGSFAAIIDKAAGLDATAAKAKAAGDMVRYTGLRAQASQLLVDAFGARGGVVLAQMVAEGKLTGTQFDTLGRQISGAKGEIDKVGDASLTLGDRAKLAGKAIELDLAPIGQKLMPEVVNALHVVLSVVDVVVGAFGHLPSGIQTAALAVLAVGAAAGPVLVILSPLVKTLQILWLSIEAGAVWARVAAASITELDLSLAGLGVAAAEALGPLALVVIGVTAAWKSWDDQAKGHRQAQKMIHDWTGSTVEDMKRLGVGVDAAFGSDVLAKLPAEWRSMADAHGVTMDDIGAGLTKNGKAWDDWEHRTVGALGSGAEASMRNAAILDSLKKAYDAAAKSTHGTATAQSQFTAALLGSGRSVQQVTIDAEKLQKAVSSAEFKKSGLAPEMLTSDMKLLGLSVQDVTSKGFDWSKFKKDIDAMNKYLDGVAQTWAGFTDLLSIDTPATDKKVQAAQDAVTKAQAAVSASHEKNAARSAAADAKAAAAGARAQLTDLRQKNTLINAQDALNKLIANPKAKPEALAAAERRLQIAQLGAKAVKATGTAASESTGPMDRLAAAQKKLSDLQESIGTSGIKKFYKDRLFEAGSFVADIAKAWKMGYDPGLISRIITAGPEKAGHELHTLVSTSSTDLVSIVNTGEKKLQEITAMALEQAHIQELAMHPIAPDPHGVEGRFMRAHAGLASLVDNLTSDAKPLTIEQIQFATGLSPENAQRLAIDFQLPFRKNPPIDALSMKQQVWDFKNWVKNDKGVQLKIDADTAPGARSLRTLKDRVDSTAGAVTIDGVAIPAIEKLTGTLVRVNASTGTVTLDADQQAALLQLKAWQDHTNKSKGTAELDANPGPANKHLDELITKINGIPFVGSALAAAMFRTANAAEVQRAAVGQKKMAGGGYIDGPIKGRDSVPILAMPGEVVIKEPSVRQFGQREMLMLNEGMVPPGWVVPRRRGYKDGGVVQVDADAMTAPLIGKVNDAIDALGGQRVMAAIQFAQSQVGKPYVWGAVGPDAYDCSGLWSAIMNVAMGATAPYRRLFTSASLPGLAASLGLQLGTGAGPLAIGDRPGSHVAGTLGGINFEATPPMVLSGPGARGAASSFFTSTFSLPAGAFVTGGNLPTVIGGDAGAISAALAGLPVDIRRALATIRTEESGGNYSARNPHGSAFGAYQFIESTYDALARQLGINPADHSPGAQDAVAGWYAQSILAANHGILASLPATWYVGHYDPSNLNYVPGGGNVETVAQYITKWLTEYASIKGFSDGGLVTRDGLYRVAEENRPELVLPLTRPSRMRQLAEEHGLADVLSGGNQRPAANSGPTIMGDVIVQVTPPGASDPENYGAAMGHRMVPVLAAALARVS